MKSLVDALTEVYKAKDRWSSVSSAYRSSVLSALSIAYEVPLEQVYEMWNAVEDQDFVVNEVENDLH